MKIKVGEMFDHRLECDVLVATGNSTVTAKNTVVMGRGAALQMRNMYPGIDAAFAGVISERERKEHNANYGFVTVKWTPVPATILGLFQVKYFFSDRANLDLIEYSFKELRKFMRKNPKLKVYMNYPGIGNGKLDEADVDKIVNKFKSLKNLTLWKLP